MEDKQELILGLSQFSMVIFQLLWSSELFLNVMHPDRPRCHILAWMHLLINSIQFQLSYTHTQPFNGPLSGTTQVSRYQKGKTNLDFAETRDSEWQWHPLCHMQVCTSLQSDNHASTPPLSFLQAGCPSCRPTNSIKALKADQSTEGNYHN